MKANEFPRTLESLSAWRGKVYRSESRGHIYYKLVYYNGAGRKTLGFQSMDEVETGIKTLLQQLGQGESGSLVLSGTEAVHYRQAQDSLSQLPCPVAINIAMNDYVETRKLVGERSMKEIAQYYIEHHGLNLTEKSVTEAVNELVREKRGHLSERHVDDLELRLGRFAKDFQCSLATITGQQVRAWLNALTGVKGFKARLVENRSSRRQHHNR